jgi:O-antigen ligase
MNGSTWKRWFGGGLPMKHIPVSGQYWQTQLLDSSWISALVQTGLVGLALTAVWVLATLASAFRTPRPWRPLWVGLVVFIGLRSLLESGLFDASTSFIVFAIVSLVTERATRTATDPGAPKNTGDLATSNPMSRQAERQRAARLSSTALTARR